MIEFTYWLEASGWGSNLPATPMALAPSDISRVPCVYFAYWCHDLHKLHMLHIFSYFCIFFLLFLQIECAAYCQWFGPLHIFCIFCMLCKFLCIQQFFLHISCIFVLHIQHFFCIFCIFLTCWSPSKACFEQWLVSIDHIVGVLGV